MCGKGIGVIENGFFKGIYLSFNLMSLQMRFELSEVVNSSFTVCSGNNIGRVLPDVSRYFTPGCFDSSDGVGKCSVLMHCRQSSSRLRHDTIDLPYQREQHQHKM